MADQRLGDRMQDQLELFIAGFEPVGQQHGWVNLRHAGAATLLTGADRHLAPVGQAFVGALILESHLAAFADDWGDDVGAQFSGFLDRPVHPLAAGQALTKVNLEA
ncbi:hypothetical protein D3C76_1674580 [compost metagenome]